MPDAPEDRELLLAVLAYLMADADAGGVQAITAGTAGWIGALPPGQPTEPPEGAPLWCRLGLRVGPFSERETPGLARRVMALIVRAEAAAPATVGGLASGYDPALRLDALHRRVYALLHHTLAARTALDAAMTRTRLATPLYRTGAPTPLQWEARSGGHYFKEARYIAVIDPVSA